MSFYGLAVRNVTSTHIGELQYLANRRRIFWSAVACWKGFAEPIDGILPDGFLYVEVVLRHTDIGVSYDTLDGREVYAQRLHLADIGMSAAVRRQERDFGNALQCFLELVTEVSWITWAVFLSDFPDKLLIRVPQFNCAVAQAFRYRDAPVTVAGLGCTHNTGSLVHVDCLLNADDRAIRFDMPGFQGQNLLGAHSGSKHQSDAETHTVFRQLFHENRYLLRGEGVLPFDGFPIAHLLCEANGILADEIVGFGLVHDLIHHSSALSQIVKRASVMAKLLQHHFDVEGFDVPDLPATEKGFECTQRVFVVFLRGGHDIVFVAFKPHVGPFFEGIGHIHLDALGLGALVRLGFVFDFFLSLAIKAFLLRVLTDEFKFHDFGRSATNLRSAGNDILDDVDRKALTERLKAMMEIRNTPELSVTLSEVHLKEIVQYLIKLDMICKIAERSDQSAAVTYRFGIAQPGLRYAQADALAKALLMDNVFGELPLPERNAILERIRNEIKGRMMEDIVLLETQLANRKKEVFTYHFDIGEFDMVVFDLQAASCAIYEVEHSTEIAEAQYRHLIDEEKCKATEWRFGTITGKYVIYRGESCEVNGIHYLNVEEYLKGLA